VSVPDRRSFEVRLPSADRFSSLPIVVSVGLPRIMLVRADYRTKPPERLAEFETNLRKERQLEDIAKAKEAGV
jgi:hypothetical protein